MPLIRGGADEIHDAIFAEGTYHAAYEPQRGIRTRRWKYVHRFGDWRTPVIVNTDDSPSKELWLEAAGATGQSRPEHLYDLFFDPVDNLVDDETPPGGRRPARAPPERWMAEMDDPLLDGPYFAPGASSTTRPALAGRADPHRHSGEERLTYQQRAARGRRRTQCCEAHRQPDPAPDRWE